jgi:plastocyanin
MNTEVKVGDAVVFVDPVARPHNALVTAVWGPTCINVVIVSNDDKKTDCYGRQIERHTSCLHRSQTPAHGNYWMLPGDTQNPVKAPEQA